MIGLSFEPNVVFSAVFGIVYGALRDRYPNSENLPIFQAPEEIRHKDPNLLNQAHHRIWNDQFAVLIGPTGIALSILGEYVGWEKLSSESKELFDVVGKLDIIGKVKRLGLRYINIFDFDIFDKVTLTLDLNGKMLESDKKMVRAEVPSGNFVSTLQVSNNAAGQSEGKTFAGSLIDIDTYTTENLDDFFEKYADLLEEGHKEEKLVFFKLLKEEYLEDLTPTYEKEK